MKPKSYRHDSIDLDESSDSDGPSFSMVSHSSSKQAEDPDDADDFDDVSDSSSFMEEERFACPSKKFKRLDPKLMMVVH